MDNEEIIENNSVKSINVFKEIGGWIVYLLFVILAVWLIVTFVGQRTKVDGHSMEPTLQHGDHLIVDKLTYHFKDPERYDIIVFPYQHAENVYYIKRIIGLPGEEVQVKDGAVYINGEKLASEQYGAEPMENPGIAETPIQLGEDEYFVLGDNRNHSSDSREASVGVLTREQVLGKAWLRIYPFDNMGVIKHE